MQPTNVTYGQGRRWDFLTGGDQAVSSPIVSGGGGGGSYPAP